MAGLRVPAVARGAAEDRGGPGRFGEYLAVDDGTRGGAGLGRRVAVGADVPSSPSPASPP
ncbi:hypothetical protein OG232_33680 [Streptomyces sp. NBC_01411]|uniref:hypothetical protein n=1 Tax=Streptomyces sp. NBC_01411 TaxID=2903857 RepID=UPI003246839C